MSDFATPGGVLDASALLALLQQERGAETVAVAIESGAAVSAVNLSEVVAKLSKDGVPPESIHQALDGLGLTVVTFDESSAYATGLLRPRTAEYGLSLGDRACLALAARLHATAHTTDNAWLQLSLGCQVTVIR